MVERKIIRIRIIIRNIWDVGKGRNRMQGDMGIDQYCFRVLNDHNNILSIIFFQVILKTITIGKSKSMYKKKTVRILTEMAKYIIHIKHMKQKKVYNRPRINF